MCLILVLLLFFLVLDWFIYSFSFYLSLVFFNFSKLVLLTELFIFRWFLSILPFCTDLFRSIDTFLNFCFLFFQLAHSKQLGMLVTEWNPRIAAAHDFLCQFFSLSQDGIS